MIHNPLCTSNLIKLEYPTEMILFKNWKLECKYTLNSSLDEGTKVCLGVKTNAVGKTTIYRCFQRQNTRQKAVSQGGGTIQDFDMFYFGL
jgi:capsid protein